MLFDDFLKFMKSYSKTDLLKIAGKGLGIASVVALFLLRSHLRTPKMDHEPEQLDGYGIHQDMEHEARKNYKSTSRKPKIKASKSDIDRAEHQEKILRENIKTIENKPMSTLKKMLIGATGLVSIAILSVLANKYKRIPSQLINVINGDLFDGDDDNDDLVVARRVHPDDNGAQADELLVHLPYEEHKDEGEPEHKENENYFLPNPNYDDYYERKENNEYPPQSETDKILEQLERRLEMNIEDIPEQKNYRDISTQTALGSDFFNRISNLKSDLNTNLKREIDRIDRKASDKKGGARKGKLLPPPKEVKIIVEELQNKPLDTLKKIVKIGLPIISVIAGLIIRHKLNEYYDEGLEDNSMAARMRRLNEMHGNVVNGRQNIADMVQEDLNRVMREHERYAVSGAGRQAKKQPTQAEVKIITKELEKSPVSILKKVAKIGLPIISVIALGFLIKKLTGENIDERRQREIQEWVDRMDFQARLPVSDPALDEMEGGNRNSNIQLEKKTEKVVEDLQTYSLATLKYIAKYAAGFIAKLAMAIIIAKVSGRLGLTPAEISSYMSSVSSINN